LAAIPGQVPSPLALPDHCAFAERCPHARPACLHRQPVLQATSPTQQAACLLLNAEEAA
jgi:peptide/nickel transport system ATP-binding protein